MIQNYFKIAWRNLIKNQTYAIINVTGLALGITCALLIFALVRYHYRIDKHHQKADRIYRVMSRSISPEGEFDDAGLPVPIGKALRNEYPQIEQLSMIQRYEEPLISVPVAKGPEKKFLETGSVGAFVEPSYFSIFDYEWLAGGPTELDQPNTVVISAKTAQKYFGTTTGIIGRTLNINAKIPTRVVGVFKDYQDNTDFPYAIMPSWATYPAFYGRPLDDSFHNTNGRTNCFLTLKAGYNPADWNRQMLAFVKKYKPKGVQDTRYPVQPLSEIHFSTATGGVSQGLMGSLFIIGVFLLVTASINFVNLATAQALRRSREVGVRKVLGSTKSQLFWQFMGETAAITLVATTIAITLFNLGESLVQQNLDGAFRFTFYYDASVIGWLAALVVGVVLLSGVYPALVLSGFRPILALTGRANTQQVGGFSVRRSLVVTQFAISQMLIIGMVVVANQMRYVQTKDLGFRRNAIMTVQLPLLPQQDVSKMRTFQHLASAIPDVEKFSYSMSGPPQTDWRTTTGVRFDNRSEEEPFGAQRKYIDTAYLDLYGIKLTAGRKLQPADTAREVLINEAFVRKLGIRDPAKTIGRILHAGGKDLEIVGVVKDFNQQSLKSEITPLYLTTQTTECYFANLQLRTGNFQRVIGQLEKDYNQIYPDSYFRHQFVDEQLEKSYNQEQTMAKIVNFFAGIAVLIGSLGLYGLVLFMANQKTKEIGVRKVLGASIGSILWLFGKEFARLILVAFLVATPLAWWVMNHWLQDFVYRIDIGPGIFGIAFAATVVVAALTVSFQSIKAALMNPVKSLRSE